MLTAPLRDRFGVVNRLEFYTDEELKTIILRSASVLDVEIDAEGAMELARRSRGNAQACKPPAEARPRFRPGKI